MPVVLFRQSFTQPKKNKDELFFHLSRYESPKILFFYIIIFSFSKCAGSNYIRIRFLFEKQIELRMLN